MSEFNGKIAIETGASSGIGRASALFYARECASVSFTYIRIERSFLCLTVF
jgi:NAD(P)-dependent dehydrogenase (short-subunit alcohol dehydrogenase family)